MKTINNYIIENLIINKNLKNFKELYKQTTLQIIEWLKLSRFKKFEDLESPYSQIILDWVEKNKVQIKDLEPCAHPETLNDHPLIDNQEKKEYNSNLDINEKCQIELDKAYNECSSKIDNFDIMSSDKMICCLDNYGAIYIIIKSKFNI